MSASSFFAMHEIDLVQDQIARRTRLLQPLDDGLGLGSDAALGVHDQRDDIGILRALPGSRHHRPLQAALGDAEDARRVDEHDLGARAVGQVGHGNADHAHARGLHLGRDDAHLRADEAVHQGRLAGIGSADHGNEAGACEVRS